MEKKPDKNQTDNNKEENKISKEKEFEIENQLDIKEDNYDDISFKDNNSQYSSKKGIEMTLLILFLSLKKLKNLIYSKINL